MWINYTGGDSVWEVADTGAAVYIQGHFKWVDNADGYASNGIGDTSDGSPAARRAGIAAIDPVAGRALAEVRTGYLQLEPSRPNQDRRPCAGSDLSRSMGRTDSAKVGAEDHYGIAFDPCNHPLPGTSPFRVARHIGTLTERDSDTRPETHAPR